MHSLSRNNTLFLILLLGVCKTISSCCVNLTVAVLMERSQADLPFVINRTIGVINRGMAKAQEILKHSVNLNFIVRYADIPTCTSLKFGALAAEVYHNNEIHTIIGPGNYIITETFLYNFDPLKPHFYMVKLGFTGVYIIFLISAQRHRLWVLVRTASQRRF